MAYKKLSWKGVYVFLRLITDNNEVDKCLLETSIFATRKAMRHLFMSIFLECQPTNPLQLWNAHKTR